MKCPPAPFSKVFSCCRSRRGDNTNQSPLIVGDSDSLDWRDKLTVGTEVCVWIIPPQPQEGSERQGHWEKGEVCAISKPSVEVQTEEGIKWEGAIDDPELLPIMKERGITVLHLRRFADKCREKIKDENILDPREYLDREKKQKNPQYKEPLDFDTMPTYLVVELFVKPTSTYRFGSTEEIRQRPVPFVDLLSDVFPDIGGPRTVTHFASHSWGIYFVDLLAAFEKLPDDAAIWICCFAMTQDDERLELVDESEVFAEALLCEGTEHILVCDRRMESLTRMWVLFEILRSVEAKKILHLRPLDVIINVADSTNNNRCSIQMSQTNCVREHDKKYIEQQMENVGGIKALNKKVREGLVGAFERGIEDAGGGDTEGVARIRALLGMTYIEQGQFEIADHELSRALEITKRLGENFRAHNIGQDEITNWNMWKGKALSLHGEGAKAVEVMRNAISKEDKWMNARLVRNSLDLSEILRRSSHFSEAEEELKKAQKYCESDSKQLVDCHLKLGQLLSHFKWQNFKAEKEFRLALKKHSDIFYNDHLTSVQQRRSITLP